MTGLHARQRLSKLRALIFTVARSVPGPLEFAIYRLEN